jgi:hypothetical protein
MGVRTAWEALVAGKASFRSSRTRNTASDAHATEHRLGVPCMPGTDALFVTPMRRAEL